MRIAACFPVYWKKAIIQERRLFFTLQRQWASVIVQQLTKHRNTIKRQRESPVADKDPSEIINMDQTPIPFSFHSTKTLKNKGTRVHTSMSDMKRVMPAAAVDASGPVLPPMLRFKGALNGHIAHKFTAYTDSGHYTCQKMCG